MSELEKVVSLWMALSVEDRRKAIRVMKQHLEDLEEEVYPEDTDRLPKVWA